MGLPFLQNLQLLHLSLGFIDAGAHSLHHLQGLLHQHVVVVLLRGPFQQLLHENHTESHTKNNLHHITFERQQIKSAAKVADLQLILHEKLTIHSVSYPFCNDKVVLNIRHKMSAMHVTGQQK